MNKRILLISGNHLGIRYDQIDYPNIEFLKYPIFVDDKEYRENDEYTGEWLMDKYIIENVVARSSTLVKSELIDIIEKHRDNFDLIVHVLMSGKMSSATFLMAEHVKKTYEKIIPIINIDTKQAVSGIGVVLLRIIELLKKHEDKDDITRLSDEIVNNTFSYFVMPDLKYLHRGGRIGKAKALMGSMLRIIPLVGIMGDDKDDGIIIPLGKGRIFEQVNSQIVSIIVEKMAEKSAGEVKLMNIVNLTDNPKGFSDLKEKLEKSISSEKTIIGELHLVESVYVGPKAYCVSICLK